MSSYVYTITHRESGKMYVGKSNCPDSRWYGHQNRAERGGKLPLYNAIRKYGVAAFDFEVIECHPNEEAAYLAETRCKLSEAAKLRHQRRREQRLSEEGA